MTELLERTETPRRDTRRTIQDYRDATGCSRVWATIHWALTCSTIVAQVARTDTAVDAVAVIELTNFTVEYEAMEASLSGRWRDE